jgi:hypothetical protein
MWESTYQQELRASVLVDSSWTVDCTVAHSGRLGVNGLIWVVSTVPFRVFSVGKYAFQKKRDSFEWHRGLNLRLTRNLKPWPHLPCLWSRLSGRPKVSFLLLDSVIAHVGVDPTLQQS